MAAHAPDDLPGDPILGPVTPAQTQPAPVATEPAPLPVSSHDDTAPQPVVGHDGLPHHHEAGAHPHEGPVTDRVSAAGHHVAAAAAGAAATSGALVHEHDVVPHHTDEPRFNAAALAASVVVAVVALGAVAGFGLLRTADGTSSATPATSTSAAASTLVTPAATGVPDATATGLTAMLPAAQPTLVLGDSLGLVVYPWLADELPDRYVSYESEVGRDTPGTVKKLAGLGSIPPVVIVSSGTNDGYAAVVEESARTMLARLGTQRCVVWVDVVRPDGIGDTAGALNSAIDRAVAGRSNVRVLRWSAMVAAHPEWMSGDGIHPNETGARARSAAFAAAAQACSPSDPTAPRAKRQVLPQSVFWGPISGQYTAPGNGTGAGSTPSTSRSASPSRSSSSSPPASASSSSSGAGSTSAPPAPPPPSSTPPPATSEPPATSSTPTTAADPSAAAVVPSAS
jgi:hypothetical protein